MNTLAAVLLVVVLPHGGHLRGGQTVSIDLRPAVEEMPAPLEVAWQLTHHSVVLQQGGLAVPEGGTTLKLELPEVRAVTALQLHHQVFADGEQLGEQETALWLHPPVAPRPALSGVVQQAVAVVSDQANPGLDTLLVDMGLEADLVPAEDTGGLIKSRWIIVDRDMLDMKLERTLGRAQARGAKVVVWEQTDPAQAPGAVLRTVAPIVWDAEHPLLSRVDPSWLEPRWTGRSAAVATRFKGPGHIVAGWPHPERPAETGKDAEPTADADADPPALLDALVWVDRTAPGLRIHWQVPVTDWSTDPLAAELLYNSLIYLAFPPPSETQSLYPPGASP